MPIYVFRCDCGAIAEELLSISDRDRIQIYCLACSSPMHRDMVYSFLTATNEASVWPQKNDALVPDDPKLERLYRQRGWLIDDGYGGETVKVENEAHFQRMLKEQKLRMKEDYERPSRSRAKRKAGKPTPPGRRTSALAAKEAARAALRKQGIRV